MLRIASIESHSFAGAEDLATSSNDNRRRASSVISVLFAFSEITLHPNSVIDCLGVMSRSALYRLGLM